MKISIIHPSRGRVKQAIKTRDKWLDKSASVSNIEYILSTDIDDTDFIQYRDNFLLTRHTINNNHSAIDAINNAAKIATGNLFIVISDDFDCPENWDKLLIDALVDKSDFIIKTDDGCQKWIITLPIMDRVYYNRFGYIYYPGYKHMFCDTEMTHVGDLLNRKITLPIKFQHNHYTQINGQPKDAINIKNDATWQQGEDLYVSRVNENFGLVDFYGKLDCDKGHLNWLRTKGVNIND